MTEEDKMTLHDYWAAHEVDGKSQDLVTEISAAFLAGRKSRDADIKCLQDLVREAMEWDWSEEETIPQEVKSMFTPFLPKSIAKAS